MTQVTTDRLAMRDGDTVKAAPREDKRPPFHPHVRQEVGKDKAEAAASATTAPETRGDTWHGSLVDVTLASPGRVPHDDMLAIPLASTDSVFGAGATIYPQGLAVVGYLSMLPVDNDTAASLKTVSMIAHAMAGDAPPVASAAGWTPSASNAVNGMSSEASSAVVVDAATPLNGNADSADATRITMDGPDLVTWLLRRMSFSGNGADATLRLRDYRIPSGQQGELANRLLAIARAQGWPVARVVVNGREIWHQSGAVPSPDTQRTQDHVG